MNDCWQKSTTYALKPSQVDVWRVWLDHEEGWMWEVLSAEEQARAKRFKFPRHRRRNIVARASLRHLLGQYLHIDPLDITLPTTKHGKPYVQQLYGTHELMFNVTHSHECALIAFTLDRLVGVDIEHVRSVNDINNIAKQFFAISEFAKLQTVPEAIKQETFLKCWTRKEAFIKAIGEGLSHPLHQFEVTFLPDEPPRLLYSHVDPDAAQKWQLFNLEPHDEYIGALIVAASIDEETELRFHQL